MAKKIALGVLAALGLVVCIILGLAASKPDTLHVERNLVMRGTAAHVFPYADDLTKFVTWMPWRDLDPEQTIEFSEPAHGVGSWYTWSGNDDVGAGRMENLSSAPGKVVHRLEFIEPFASVAETSLIMKDLGDGQVEVTWVFDQDADFATKLMTVFVDMDAMLGADFEKGLAKLGPLVEADAAGS